MVSKYRPRCPIIGVTRNEIAARQMHLWRGIYPLVINEPKPIGLVAGDQWLVDVESRVQKAIDVAKAEGFSRKNDTVIVVTGWKGGSGNTNTLRVIQIN